MENKSITKEIVVSKGHEFERTFFYDISIIKHVKSGYYNANHVCKSNKKKFKKIKRNNYWDEYSEKLNNMCTELRNKYQYPSLFSSNCPIITIQNSHNTSINDLLNQILSIISRDLNSGVNNRIIYIQSDINTVINRIKKRGRVGEDSYSELQLKEIQNIYNKLYLN